MNDTGSATGPGAGAGVLVLGVIYLVVIVFTIWAYVRIIKRSGYSGWWVLVGLVPVLNVIMFFVFAFKRSPAEQELDLLRSQLQQPRYDQRSRY